MPNTVKDLIETLSKLPQDAIVLLASDEEGNSYHAWTDYGIGIGEKDGYGYEFHSRIWYDEDGDELDEALPIPDEDINAIVLWP